MRSLLRAGLLLGFVVAACKDSPGPVDFNDPAAVSANLQSVDSAFDSDVFRSFSTATFMLDPAAPTAMGQITTLLETTRPSLKRAGGGAILAGTLQARRLQALVPDLSIAAAQGQIIPDSLYNRVFEWDTALNEYTFQGTTTTGLSGVRFVLYAVGLDNAVVEPVSAIGTLDIIDQSTLSTLQLQVLVKGPGGAPTYLDYTIALTSNSQTSATATASGTISNGLSAGANKTLSFDETFTVSQTAIRANATFALNNPIITVTLNESLTLEGENLIISVDFRIIRPGETIRTAARFTTSNLLDVTVNVTVYVNGHPVASISGDPTDPATQWRDAGGEPLTLADLAALDHLFDALESFEHAVSGLFSPFNTLVTL